MIAQFHELIVELGRKLRQEIGCAGEHDRRNFARSPRLIARIPPVRMPPTAWGSTMRRIICQRVAPSE